MNPGKLDRRVTIQVRVQQTGTDGFVTESWVDLFSVYAARENVAASRRSSDGLDISTSGEVFTVRYRAGISTAHRLIFEGRPYAITSVTEIGRRDGMRLTAETAANPAQVR
jgi:SPP1 family predicted phage head-tail adaptor